MPKRKTDRQTRYPSDEIHRFMKEGQSCLDNRKWEAAQTAFSEVLKRDPRNMTAHDKLGIATARRGDFEQAESCFNNMLASDPRSKRAFNNTGNLYLERGEPEKAIRCYERAIRIDGNYATAYYNMSAAYKRMGDLRNYVKNNKIAARITKHERRRQLQAFLKTLWGRKDKHR